MSKKPTPLPTIQYAATSGVPLTADDIKQAARRRRRRLAIKRKINIRRTRQ